MMFLASLLRSRLGKAGKAPVARGRRPWGSKLLVERLEDRVVLSTTWIPEGPAPITDPGPTADLIVLPPNNPTSGAVTAVVADPANANLVYVGTTNGGVWKTTNATNNSPTWTPLTDNLPSLSIGALAMQPGNPSVLYAGTADLSSLSRMGGPRSLLYKTTNAGATWTTVGQDNFAGAGSSVEDVISIAPSTALSGNLVLVTTGLGRKTTTGDLYRSTDGGTTWEYRTSLGGLPNFVPDQVINDPGDTTGMSFYASFPKQGVYRSSDGGLNWTAVNTGLTGYQTLDRLSLSIFNFGGQNVVYASLYANNTITGIFRSTDRGANWTTVGTSPFTESVGITHGAIAADPRDPNIVYVSGDTYPTGLLTPLFRGDATTGTWTLMSGPNANNTNPHDDTRALAFDANGNLLLGSDGGIARLVNAGTPASRTWQPVDGNLQTVEYHSVGYDSLSHVIFGGAQDDGTSYQNSRGSLTWTLALGGDGGNVAVDNDQTAHPGTTIRYTSTQFLTGLLQSNRFVWHLIASRDIMRDQDGRPRDLCPKP